MGIGEGIRRIWRNPAARAFIVVGLTAVGVRCARQVEDTRTRVSFSPDSREIEAQNVSAENLRSWEAVARYNAQVCGINGLPNSFFTEQAKLLQNANPGATPTEAKRGELEGIEKYQMPNIGTTVDLAALVCPPCVQTGAAQPAAGTQTSPTAPTIPDFYAVPGPFTSETIEGLAIQAGKSLAQPLAINLPQGVRLDTYEESKVHLWMELLPTGTGTNLDCQDSWIEVNAHAEGGQLVIDSLRVDRRAYPPTSDNPAVNLTFEVRVAAFLGRKLEQGQQLPAGVAPELPIDLVLQFSVSPAERGSGSTSTTGTGTGGTLPGATTVPFNQAGATP